MHQLKCFVAFNVINTNGSATVLLLLAYSQAKNNTAFHRLSSVFYAVRNACFCSKLVQFEMKKVVFCLEVLHLSQPNKIMSSWLVNLLTLFLGRLRLLIW